MKLQDNVCGYWNNSVKAVKDLPVFMDENILYNIHCYEPYIYMYQGAEWINGMPGDFRCSLGETLKEHRLRCEETTPALLAGFDGVWDSAGMDYFVHVLKEAADIASSRNKLLYCGGYGVIENAKQEEKELWIEEINKVFNYYGIGKALRTYKGMLYGFRKP